MVETKIKELREKKYTIEQIADELGMTTGQVRYRLYKKAVLKGSNEGENMLTISEVETEFKTNESITNSVNRDRLNPSGCNQAIFLNTSPPPPYYGENDLRIMVQGPTSIYVYWEITWPLMKIIAEYLYTPYEQLNKLLRIYDVTDILFNGVNAHWHRDILVQPTKDDQFIHELVPGRTYTIDFGIQYEGRMITFLRSKPKSTPLIADTYQYKELVQYLIDQEEGRIKPRGFENFSAYTIY